MLYLFKNKIRIKTKNDEEFKETKQVRVDYDKGVQNPPHCWNRWSESMGHYWKIWHEELHAG
ncbi:unnamed protein product [Rhodiola kirilowii]